MTSWLPRDVQWPHQQLDVCRKCDRSISQRKGAHFCVCSDLDGSHMWRDPFNPGQEQRVQTEKKPGSRRATQLRVQAGTKLLPVQLITWPETTRLEWWMIHFWERLLRDERADKKWWWNGEETLRVSRKTGSSLFSIYILWTVKSSVCWYLSFCCTSCLTKVVTSCFSLKYWLI